MLREALPRFGVVETSSRDLVMGYVDHGDFTLYPVFAMWAAQRPMAGGRIVAQPGGCRILLRVANSNWTVYLLTLWTALFWGAALLILFGTAFAAAEGRALSGIFLLIWAIFGILVPAAFLMVLGYRRVKSGDGGHADAAFALQFLEDLFGLRPTPS